MIRFEQVGKRYPGGIAALAELTFAVESGEMVILSGHSGAGKSTLLKLIPAIERPTQGAVVVNGQNVAALKRAAIPFLRRNIGMIFQDQKLLYDRSAFDNVMLPLAIARAVVARPSILIADEPTAHLDDDTARDIATTFHAFNQVGVTVLVATHHESLFAPFMTRRITLAHGRLLP